MIKYQNGVPAAPVTPGGRTVGNRRKWSPVAAAVLTALALALGACGDDDNSAAGGSADDASTQAKAPAVKFESPETAVPEGYPEPQPGKLRLAYLNPVGGNEFLHTLGEAMRLETEKLGGQYTELDAKGDVNTQVGQFDQLIAQKVDGIAVFALDPGSVAPEVKRAKKAGIKLAT
jgi:ABC-type sugar transport system substrate-binding protein